MKRKTIVLICVFSLLLTGIAFAGGKSEAPASSGQTAAVSRPAAGPEKKTGPYNAITDVPGIEVGNYQKNNTGTTVVLIRKGAVGGVDVRGSSPGTRETDLLDPVNQVNKVDAVVLSGGSAYGLAAADGVMLWLEENKIGWPVGGGNLVPIVPSAILYDPGRFGRAFNDRPTADFGRRAAEAAKTGPVEMGNIGAGAGAITGGLKGGLGTASIDLGNGIIVGAIVAVNAGGCSVVNPNTGEFYAAHLEIGNEFGGLKRPAGYTQADALPLPIAELAKNTTIAVVATNVTMNKAQITKVAQMAHDGYARAMNPAHTMFDGDTIFSLATGEIPLDVLQQTATWGNMHANVNKIGAAAADCVARAIVHAMLNAQSIGDVKSYLDAYPGAR